MKWRNLITLLAAGIAIIGVAYFALTPTSPCGTFPAQFSNAERLEIESAIQRERYARCIDYLKGGEFREALRWLRRSRAQKIWDVGIFENGAIWLNVGIINEHSDQKVITGRFFMKREFGNWKITLVLP